MSDEVTTSSNGGKGGGKEPPHRDLSAPVIKDRALFDFLEQLFYTDPEPEQYPERIELNVVSGRYSEQLKAIIWTKEFAPIKASTEAKKQGAGAGKPNKEQLVSLSNHLLQQMQQDCDACGHRRSYGVHAWSLKRGEGPYMRFLKSVDPSGRYPRNGDGENGEEEEALDKRDKFIVQMAAQQNDMHTSLGALIAGLLDRYNRDKERDSGEIDRLHKMLAQKNEQLERALSLELDREERREWVRLRRQMADKGWQVVERYGPSLMASLTGKGKIIAGTVEDVPAVLLAFLKSATEDQLSTTFGDWDQANCIRQGLLTPDQALIFVHVAQGKLPVVELDKIIPPSGPFAITQQQLVAFGQIFSVDQLKPLHDLFMKRQPSPEGAK